MFEINFIDFFNKSKGEFQENLAVYDCKFFNELKIFNENPKIYEKI